MSAPVAMPDGTQSCSRQNQEPLEERLRKLLPPPITSEDEKEIEKIASGVRGKIKVAADSDNADSSIGEGLRAIEAGLKYTHNWCTAQKVIGEELGKADDQPVRRIVSPPQKKVTTVPKEPEEDQASSEEFADSALDQPVRPSTALSPSRRGRKMKWEQDREDVDAFIARTVEDSEWHLPFRDGEAHPRAVDLLSRLIKHLGVPSESLVEALRSNPAVSLPDGELDAVAD
jgi:hypothetical protein